MFFLKADASLSRRKEYSWRQALDLEIVVPKGDKVALKSGVLGMSMSVLSRQKWVGITAWSTASGRPCTRVYS